MKNRLTTGLLRSAIVASILKQHFIYISRSKTTRTPQSKTMETFKVIFYQSRLALDTSFHTDQLILIHQPKNTL